MNSLDTNVLLYATNQDCPEHERARALVSRALAGEGLWIVADQVWFELYRMLRNPALLGQPLSAKAAAETIQWYQDNSGWLRCAWEPGMMDDLRSLWNRDSFSGRNTFDAVLAVTLKRHGVTKLFTRNKKDFDAFGFFQVEDPID
ncbi:MAG: PIN domain-containing protein [Spirochaetes bacterium]|jgi:toxin-antitoxin system PIN domain toxin|nr:PIN domain-containing protein [Spirochaetota bacterium]